MKMPELMSTMSAPAGSLSDYSSLCSRREILCPKSPTVSVLGQDFPHAFLAESHLAEKEFERTFVDISKTKFAEILRALKEI